VTNRVYRAGTIKRARRTRAQLEQLGTQILDVLRFDHPQSVRHVFYRLTDPRLPEPVEKSERGYRHVQDRCVKLRRAGLLPYGWITDATRRGYFTTTYGSTSEFLRRVAGLYRADLWAESDFYCEVWAESRSIAGVIQDDCKELAVSLYPAGGFTSVTLAYEAAELINAIHGGRFVVILYNAADALWLLHGALDAYGCPPVTMPKSYREALTVVAWPRLQSRITGAVA
jgi:hypothetical protein